MEKCDLTDLRRLRGVSANYLSLQPFCYQCSLAFVQPSQVNAPDGVWRREANKKFIDKTDGIELEAEVYSVLNGIVRVFLRANGETINRYLINENLAEHCEESYLSKVFSKSIFKIRFLTFVFQNQSVFPLTQ